MDEKEVFLDEKEKKEHRFNEKREREKKKGRSRVGSVQIA